MPSGSVLDKYDQFAVIKVPFVAATSSYNLVQLVTGLTTQQKVAWLLHRVEFYFSPAALDGMIAGADYTRAAIIQASANSTDETASYVVDSLVLNCNNTPVSDNARTYFESPFVHDFGASERLMIPQNVYAFLGWTHNTAPGPSNNVIVRMWYRELELSPQDWYDLAQLRMPLGGT